MSTLLKLTTLAVVAVALSSSFAAAGPNKPIIKLPVNGPILNLPQNNGPKIPIIAVPGPKPLTPNIPILPILPFPSVDHDQPNGYVAIECKVKSAFGTTDDMWLINTGNVELPSGIQIKFRVPSTGDHGVFLLPRTLDVGEKLKLSDLLHDAETGAPCAVKVLA
jgi:hypothetical protein